jgi:uncharacterized membrane protein
MGSASLISNVCNLVYLFSIYGEVDLIFEFLLLTNLCCSNLPDMIMEIVFKLSKSVVALCDLLMVVICIYNLCILSCNEEKIVRQFYYRREKSS